MPPRLTDPSLRAVQEELLGYEPIFHNVAFGNTREDYERRMSEDYWQVGASGRIYERDAVIESVVERGKVPGDEHWVISGPCCRQLGDHTFGLSYQLDQDGRITRRLTVWRRGVGGWHILYHQGTVVADDCPAPAPHTSNTSSAASSATSRRSLRS